MKKLLVVPLLLVLSACNDSTVERVQSQPAAPDLKTTLGEVLDKRPVCDKTVWTETAATAVTEARVDYQCTLSATQMLAAFSSQQAIWLMRYQQRITDGEAMRSAVPDNKVVEQPLLDLAQQTFDALQSSGDLPRYKALIKDSPVFNQSLEAVETFFASDAGKTYLNQLLTAGDEDKKMLLGDAETALASLQAVTEVMTDQARDPRNMDICKTPALLVLSPVLSPAAVEQGFTECRTSADARTAAARTEVEGTLTEARTRLEKVKALTLVGVKETLSWSVSIEGDPQLSRHTLELSVKEGDQTREVIREMGFAEGDMAQVMSGQFTRAQQDMLVSAMSDRIR